MGTTDVDSVTGLLRRTLATGCFDPTRVSVAGLSNGAGCANRMACKLPGQFAAGVSVAGRYRALDPCPTAIRASFLAIHGTADQIVRTTARSRTARATWSATPPAGRSATAARPRP
jgi:polyhydroxybutyrate depolymerase